MALFLRRMPALVALLAALGSACAMSRMAGGNLQTLVRSIAPAPSKVSHVPRPDARLAVLWVGHATTIVQIDDKFILTDPVFTSTVGQFSKRLVEPGVEPNNVPPIDAVLISHMHFDHLSLGTLELLERKIRRVYVPQGGLVYIPNFNFDSIEVPLWKTYDDDGLRITAVPTRHVGWRYGADRDWMTTSFSGWVIEYHGLTVYFGGDTGYEPENFRQAAARFTSIDLALLPIAPIHPRPFMERNHEDPNEAVLAFLDLHAKHMVPIHFDTFVNSLDAIGEPGELLVRAMHAHGLTEEQVHILAIGEQKVIVASRPSLGHAGAD
jgi:N-acyl-phosphatidylethanolamine-hydrolysing phospholipase D